MDKRRTWFTSDIHWGHSAIVGFCKRPYRDVEEMNEALVRNFNSVVAPGDRVFFLGDIAFVDPIPWVTRLNGERFLIAGNHDESRMGQLKKCKFGWIKDTYMLETGVCPAIWLAHYPHRAWPGSYHGTWHLFGHTHGFLPGTETSLDVGVDSWSYYPVPLETIMERLRWPQKGDRLGEPELKTLPQGPAE